MSGGAFSFKSESAKPVEQESPRAPLHGSALASQAAPAPSKSDALAMLAEIASRKPPTPHKQTGPAVHPKTKLAFEAGVKPSPRSGHTVHDVFNDPTKLADLQSKVSEWEKANPKRKLMGPHVHKMFPHMSHSQARNVAKKVNDKHQKFLESKVSSYYGKGAKAALRGKQ